MDYRNNSIKIIRERVGFVFQNSNENYTVHIDIKYWSDIQIHSIAYVSDKWMNKKGKIQNMAFLPRIQYFHCNSSDATIFWKKSLNLYHLLSFRRIFRRLTPLT